MEQQHEEQEHEVYGGEIPDEGEMDADVEMSSRVEDEDLQDPNSKELEDMKKRLKEIEEEAGALREMQAKVEKEMGAVQDPRDSSIGWEPRIMKRRSLFRIFPSPSRWGQLVTKKKKRKKEKKKRKEKKKKKLISKESMGGKESKIIILVLGQIHPALLQLWLKRRKWMLDPFMLVMLTMHVLLKKSSSTFNLVEQ
ncbi:uncharacterized protein LOC133870726 isoform X2 [Alnus glutinosa]|uniref:uncharacterized protein LOC133870726 isoform X2 n=1 Tax=Alnus glutinosa TaxID=3517 RepID=UPI002D76A119|nr:uncharacterized protein LOC133870726 isoform X2 [Alnus glutinosa]